MTKQPERENAPRPTRRDQRKPYRAPQLVEYGDLRKITLGKGGMMNDMGGLPATRK
jgi:hypothetical protein